MEKKNFENLYNYKIEQLEKATDEQIWLGLRGDIQFKMFCCLFQKYKEIEKDYEEFKKAIQYEQYDEDKKQRINLFKIKIDSYINKYEEEKLQKKQKKTEKTYEEELYNQKLNLFEQDQEYTFNNDYEMQMNPTLRKGLLQLRMWDQEEREKEQAKKNHQKYIDKYEKKIEKNYNDNIILKKKEIKEPNKENSNNLEQEFEEISKNIYNEIKITSPLSKEKYNNEKKQNYINQFLGSKRIPELSPETKLKEQREENRIKIRKIIEQNEKNDNNNNNNNKNQEENDILVKKSSQNSPIKFSKETHENYQQYKNKLKEIHQEIPKDNNKQNIYEELIGRTTKIIKKTAEHFLNPKKLIFEDNSNLSKLIQSGDLSKEFEKNLKTKEQINQIENEIKEGKEREEILFYNRANHDIKTIRDDLIGRGNQNRFQIKTLKDDYATKIGKKHVEKILKYFEKQGEVKLQKQYFIFYREEAIKNRIKYKNEEEENIYKNEYSYVPSTAEKTAKKEQKEEKPKEEPSINIKINNLNIKNINFN